MKEENYMKPIEFKEQNHVWAKDQLEYLPLPSYINEEDTISCWKLSWWERLKLFWTGKLWLIQKNFQQPLQPQLLLVDNPFGEVTPRTSA